MLRYTTLYTLHERGGGDDDDDDDDNNMSAARNYKVSSRYTKILSPSHSAENKNSKTVKISKCGA